MLRKDEAMDRLDIRLLGQLARGFTTFGPRTEVKGAYRRIAKNLGVDEDTIRKRVERLRTTGLFRGWRLIVNPRVLGVEIFAVWMTVGPALTVDAAIRKIRLLPGVVRIIQEVGDELGVLLLCKNQEVFKKRLELISELVDARNVMTYFNQPPKIGIEITKTDWEVTNRLRRDPDVRYSQLAMELRLSGRTVKRRVTRLIDGEAIFFIPDINVKLLEGAVCIDLLVNYTSGSYKREVDTNIFSRFQEYLWRAGFGGTEQGHFEFIVPSVSVAQEIDAWVRGLKGVRAVRLAFVYDWMVFSTEAMDEIIRAKIDHSTG